MNPSLSKPKKLYYGKYTTVSRSFSQIDNLEGLAYFDILRSKQPDMVSLKPSDLKFVVRKVRGFNNFIAMFTYYTPPPFLSPISADTLMRTLNNTI